jgi:hypothetical protein
VNRRNVGSILRLAFVRSVVACVVEAKLYLRLLGLLNKGISGLAIVPVLYTLRLADVICMFIRRRCRDVVDR